MRVSLAIAGLFGLAFLLSGCQTETSTHPGSRVPPVLAASAAVAGGLSPEEANAGAKLYAAKCARCHKFYDPASYTEPEWQSWMLKMNRKARLNSDQRDRKSVV